MNDNKMTSLELRAAWSLGAIFSLRMFGMFMVLPVLSTYGMLLQDANKTLIGLAIGIYGLTQAIFQIPFGLLSDRFGRKPLIIGGLLLFVLGSIMAAITTSIWGIIWGRVLQGSGAITAVVMALLSDLIREQNRTKAMALIGINFGITFAIAMIIGPILTHNFGGLHAIFWTTAILASLGIIIIILVVPQPQKQVVDRQLNIIKSSILTVLYNSKLIKLNISIFCLHILLMSSFVVLPSQFKFVGLPLSEHWKVYLVTMLVSFISIVPFIIYAEVKHRIKQVIIGCILLILITEIILWKTANHFSMLILGVQLFFFAFNLMEAILPSLISKESPVGYKGTAMGVYSTSQFLGVAIGGSMGGWVYSHFHTEMVFLVNTIIALTWLLVSLSMAEPLYFSTLHIVLSDELMLIPNLEECLKAQPGVSSVLIVLEERSIYVKIDNKITSRRKLESIINNCIQSISVN